MRYGSSDGVVGSSLSASLTQSIYSKSLPAAPSQARLLFSSRRTKNLKKSRNLSGKIFIPSHPQTINSRPNIPLRLLLFPTNLTECHHSEWRSKRDAELARRAEASEERKAETVQKAQQDIDDYYESYNKRTDKARERTRREAEEFLANREDTAVGGTSWERIAKLVDVSGKGLKGGASGSGKERFREILLDLKKDQNAPGASGV